MDKAVFLFKLRGNIALEGDILLARMELEALLRNRVEAVADFGELRQAIPELARLDGHGALESGARAAGVKAFQARGPLRALPRLVRRVAFVQRIYCVTEPSDEVWEFLEETPRALGPVLAVDGNGGRLAVQAVPHYALLELSDVIARRSTDVEDVKRNLTRALDALLGRTSDPGGLRLAADAMSAKSTTSHLSHDLHYYKAKFFPRMARALLNVCGEQGDGNPGWVIDNFAGSGTTLLEAALLGIPSVGLDIDPLSVLIAQTKLEVLRLDSALVAEEAEKALRRLETLPPGCPLQDGVAFPDWLMKNRRMTPAIAAGLREEILRVRAVVDAGAPAVHNLFRVLLSDAIARRIRMRFLGTGVGRFSLTFSKASLVQMFAKSLTAYTKVAATREWLQETIGLQFADAQVRQADARRAPRDLGRFTALVTSPPYLPAASGRESYAQARAPSLIALGMANHRDVDALANEAIGAMTGGDGDVSRLTPGEREAVRWLQNDALRAIKAAPTARYFLDMRRVFGEMQRCLVPGACAVVVSGKQSTFYEFASRQALYVVPAAELLADEAHRAGFEVTALHDIRLQKANKNARPRSRDDYYETLIMLRKPQ